MNTYSYNPSTLLKQAVLLILVCLLIPLSCKKDKVDDRQLYLSKVYEDALLKEEYIYSADKKLLRVNGYNTSSGQSEASTIKLYDYYPDGLLKDVTMFYASTNQFFNKYRLQYDANGRPARMDDLDNDNSIQFYHVYDYDAQGRLAKYSLHNANSNKKTSEGYFFYDADDRITMTKRYIFPGLAPVLYDSVNYSFEEQLPAHWKYFETLAFIALPNGYRTFYDMICSDMFYYYQDAPPSKANYDFTEKTYNREGYLTRQRISIDQDFPPVVNSHELTYEYVE